MSLIRSERPCLQIQHIECAANGADVSYRIRIAQGAPEASQRHNLNRPASKSRIVHEFHILAVV